MIALLQSYGHPTPLFECVLLSVHVVKVKFFFFFNFGTILPFYFYITVLMYAMKLIPEICVTKGGRVFPKIRS